MKSIKNKLMLIFMTLSIVPVLAIGTLSYIISANTLLQKLNRESISTLAQISKNVDATVQKIDNYMNVFFTSEKLQQMLAEVNFSSPSGDIFMAYYKMDPMINSLLESDKDVQSALFISLRGGQYVYKGYIKEPDKLRDSFWYRDAVNAQGHTMWGGMIPNVDSLSKAKDVYVVSRLIRDTTYAKNLEPLGAAAIFLDSGTFSGIYKGVEIGDDDVVVIFDEKGRWIAGNREDKKNLQEYPFSSQVLNASSGSFKSKIKGSDRMITFYSSPETGWKVLRIVPYSFYLKDIHSIAWLTAIICILCIILVFTASSLISGRIALPVRRVVEGMKKVGEKDFNASVPVTTQDEIGLISRGFNEMVDDIRTLFKKAIEEEKSKQEAQLEALQYQINPHFLYNTLGSIRFAAIMENAQNVSEMLLVLNRLLRKTINKGRSLVFVSEEIDNVRDYIYIQQIRYKNRIAISYSIDDSIARLKVPNMLLQPIVENALEHGLNRKLCMESEESIIKISACLLESRINFEVWDNGTGMTEKEILDAFSSKTERDSECPSHIGIKNIHDRMRIKFGHPFGITIESVPGEFTLVRLMLPAIEEENEYATYSDSAG